MTGPLRPGCSEADRKLFEEGVRHVLDSRTFAKSFRLATLFEYICRHSLDGHPDELTEQQIGIHVFQRHPGYNSAEDTIVRGTARHLRQRLETYYEQEGTCDEIRISIPKGGYVAMFLAAERWERAPGETQTAIDGAAVGVVPPAAPDRMDRSWPRSAKAVCVAAVMLAVVLPPCTWLLTRRQQPAQNTGPAILWRLLFQPDRKTLIIPGDAALDAFISLEQKPVTLEQYTEQSYQRQATVASTPINGGAPVGGRSMTPMSALRLVADLVQVPGWIGLAPGENRTEIRYARDVNAADISNINLIVIGSKTFNPWTTLFQPELDFSVSWDLRNDMYTVVDRAPRGAERSEYTYDPKHGPLGAMTLVALTDNTQGGGKVLLIEGTTMGATYGGMRFLFDRNLWTSAITAATDRMGRLHNFEVLLQNDFLRGGVSNTRIVAVHVH